VQCLQVVLFDIGGNLDVSRNLFTDEGVVSQQTTINVWGGGGGGWSQLSFIGGGDALVVSL
jgi:hypothetical protein